MDYSNRKVKECKYTDVLSCRWCEYSAYPELFDGGCRLHYTNEKSRVNEVRKCEICGKAYTATSRYDRVCSWECGKKVRKTVKAEYLLMKKNKGA